MFERNGLLLIADTEIADARHLAERQIHFGRDDDGAFPLRTRLRDECIRKIEFGFVIDRFQNRAIRGEAGPADGQAVFKLVSDPEWPAATSTATRKRRNRLEIVRPAEM